jgi:hypothetical protein
VLLRSDYEAELNVGENKTAELLRNQSVAKRSLMLRITAIDSARVDIVVVFPEKKTTTSIPCPQLF